MDRFFRVFNNSKYTHIDPKQQQDDLTSLVEVPENEPFVLHPGEFVLGATLEKFTLPAHLAGRLEGKSSLGRLGLLTHSTAGFIVAGHEGGAVGAVLYVVTCGDALRFGHDRLEVSGSARANPVEGVSEFPFLSRCLLTPRRSPPQAPLRVSLAALPSTGDGEGGNDSGDGHCEGERQRANARSQ